MISLQKETSSIIWYDIWRNDKNTAHVQNCIHTEFYLL